MNLNEECLLYFLNDTKRLNESIEKLKNYVTCCMDDNLPKPNLNNEKLLPSDV